MGLWFLFLSKQGTRSGAGSGVVAWHLGTVKATCHVEIVLALKAVSLAIDDDASIRTTAISQRSTHTIYGVKYLVHFYEMTRW